MKSAEASPATSVKAQNSAARVPERREAPAAWRSRPDPIGSLMATGISYSRKGLRSACANAQKRGQNGSSTACAIGFTCRERSDGITPHYASSHDWLEAARASQAQGRKKMRRPRQRPPHQKLGQKSKKSVRTAPQAIATP